MNLFVDTWGWVAVADRRDAGHASATKIYRTAQQAGRIVTSNFVLSETFTLLFKRRPFEDAWRFTVSVVESPIIDIQEVTRTRFFKAIELRRQFADKPRISFTDLTSMIVASELKISDILTGDRHFHQAGLGFRILP